ncbi:MFS general substrate transporter [Fusarium albosuccineum]|uniref:MFS general substrate transporter n=1 Tax=Fusarium albosuccineum TaxID=1237068 RepID=A0A8H4L269_9HYPO|nr:MFS general substrate transporter [Fusarium albosuccineum]
MSLMKEEEKPPFTQHDENTDRDHSPRGEPANFTYGSVQFIVTFLSISFSFYAAFLGTSPTWNMLTSNVPLAMAPSTTIAWAYPTLLFSQALSAILLGRISDFVGRRWVFVLGNLIAFVGFLATGRVSDARSIVGLAVLIGIGTGIQIIGPFLALAELVPVRHRYAVVGASLSLLAPLFAMNPAIAEALYQNTSDSWRWPYSINAILSFVATVGLTASYHPPTHRQLHDDPEAEHLKSKDWKGLITLAISFSLLTYFLLWGATIYAWDTPKMIALVTVFGFVVVAFFVYVWFIPSAIPVLFKGILSESGMKQGWDTSCWSAGLVAGFILASLACMRPKFVKWHLVGGIAVAMIFLSALTSTTSSRAQMAKAFLTLSGIGQGYSLLVSGVTASLVVHRRDIGIVAGILAAFRNLFFAILQAVFMSIFQPRLQNKMVKFVSGAVLEGGLPQTSLPALFEALAAAQATGDPSALLQVPGITPALIQTAMMEVVRATTNAWKFIFSIANIYFIGTLIIAVLAANTDRFLSLEIWAHLSNPKFKRGGQLRSKV